MKRGEIWTASGGPDYASKPRPVVIIQDDYFDANDSVTVCPLTTDVTIAPIFRISVEPNEVNGLREHSSLVVDKISTVPRSKVGQRVGRINDGGILRLNRAILVFLGLTSSSPRP